MDLSKLQTLKEMMLSAKDFTEPWNYFFDHFGEDPRFFDYGRPARETSLLKIIIARTGRQIFRRKVKVKRLLLTELEEQHFIHGTCRLHNKLATILYFTDIQVGMMAIEMNFTTGETVFTRFTTAIMPKESGKKGVVPPLPPDSKIIH